MANTKSLFKKSRLPLDEYSNANTLWHEGIMQHGTAPRGTLHKVADACATPDELDKVYRALQSARGETRWKLIGVLGRFGSTSEAKIIRQHLTFAQENLGINRDERDFCIGAQGCLGGADAVHSLVSEIILHSDEKAVHELIELAIGGTEFGGYEDIEDPPLQHVDPKTFIDALITLPDWKAIHESAERQGMQVTQTGIALYLKMLRRNIATATRTKDKHPIASVWDKIRHVHTAIQQNTK